MSYRANGSQQLSIFDRSLRLTRRERSFLEKSWAKVFSDEIFPAIDEERFRVLYSQNASRPNTPVNIIVGALIIKELFTLSDDEIVENLMLDIHYQYALHTTSYEEQPLSDKSLSRFRKRCYEYEKTTGVDLFHECVCDLNRKIAKLMGINSHIKRMDSLMIEANIRKLSRIELLYSCVARLAKRIEKKEGIGKLTGLEHYCQPGDRNFIVYHCRNTDMNERMETILKDADQLLLRSAAQYQETEEYRLLVRCLDEQTIAGSGGRRLRKKGEESPSTTSLQNPTDPDATYCAKAGKDHIGYAANVVESVDSSGSVITDYQYEKNIFSDPRFLRDHLTRTEEQKETVRIVADGGYVGQECRELAAEQNIELINTALKGVAVPDIYGGFLLSDNGKSVQQCPAGYAPIRCSYTERTSRIRAYFKSEHCMGCDHREECQAKQRRATCQMSLSRSAVERARQQQQMHAPDFQNWHRIRNGIESVPSILRNRYQVDKMPVRGFIPSKFFFGAKISAMNFNKLLRHRRGLLSCAQNPLLS